MRSVQMLITASILCLSLNTLEAQIIDHYGLKVSVVRSSFRITDITPVLTSGGVSLSPDFIEGPSYHPAIGLFARSNALGDLGLEAEMLYIQKGASKTFNVVVTTASNPDGNGRTIELTNKINLDYLQFGLNIQPRVQLRGMSLFASIGPSVNYLLSIDNFAPKADMKTTVLGYNLGLGVTLEKMAPVPVFVELKYGGDLSSFYSAFGTYWNQVFQINVGVGL